MMPKSQQRPTADTVTNSNFCNKYENETWIQGSVPHAVHMTGSLNFDIANSNSYLLDDVSISIR